MKGANILLIIGLIALIFGFLILFPFVCSAISLLK